MDHQPDPQLAALSPVDLLTVLLYGEARGESVEAQVAVGWSVYNRLHDPRHRYGSTLPEIILRWAQYSCLWPTLGGGNYQAVLAFAERLTRHAPLQPVERQLIWVAQGLITGVLLDPTNGATHYFDKSIKPPEWAAVSRLARTIDPFSFYSNVP